MLPTEKLTRLRAGLESLRARYDARYLSSDPLELPRRFQAIADRELVGLLASSLAYGNVTTIRASVERLLALLGPHPCAFTRSIEPRRHLDSFVDFRHRWTRGRDVVCLLYFARQMMERFGSIGGFFRAHYDPSEAIDASLTRFSDAALALDHDGLYGTGVLPRSAGVRYFFPSPRSGSACKRLNMLLRWMVRPDDGIDLGIWDFVSPSQLVIPLDTHITRIGLHLGWARRKTPGWKMAQEITRVLAQLDPADPIKYDFVLSRLGILEGCPRHPRSSRCDLCELKRTLRLRKRAA